MNELEKFVDHLNELSNKSDSNEKGRKEIKPEDLKNAVANRPDFLRILKLFVSERKKMWKSILNHIESMEKEENELKEILELDEEEFNSLINEEFEMSVDEPNESEMEQESMLNRTFTKFEINDNNNPYDNPSMYLDTTEELNSILDLQSKDESSLTPIPKPVDKKKKRKSSLFQSSLYTIDESSIF